ncbi:conjugal transfer protein [Robiginitalea sp. M366]|uniref:conjugal transfer protein n=1 Tax=Robiginitalea aestuariiviva TaxID=3036903 RepID=UPI00240D2D46|nr:conjugal transfer protein [Robiginitalea aestuariiviva]MDG1573301.1 conjugal transfer protein [Robiginitalea aestuariiviva]
MKRIVILAVLILTFSAQSAAQGMPVYDNTNFISLTKSLFESAKQTAELLKTVEFLREQKDNIVKVNAVIRELKAASELTRNHQRLFKTVRGDLRQILSSPYIHPDEVSRISSSFEAIMTTAIDDLELINHILSSDFLKMSDAERTSLLLTKERQSQEMVAEITQKTERYRDIIAFRRMQDLINNRETNY